jgi:hypothetical protein
MHDMLSVVKFAEVSVMTAPRHTHPIADLTWVGRSAVEVYTSTPSWFKTESFADLTSVLCPTPFLPLYSVVMYSGGAELDMRGRCSAGQKVIHQGWLLLVLLPPLPCAQVMSRLLDEPMGCSVLCSYTHALRLVLAVVGIAVSDSTSHHMALV